jgi:NAD(P)-dependent dehydrogenase (short-subunit alcohol dehydrogenase family)
VVLITGASSGIGRVCAEHLHANGYRVYGTSRNAQWPGPAVGQASSPPYCLLPLDVTSDTSVAAAVQLVVEREDALDVLVNNAGFGIAGAVEDTTIDEAREQFDTNFFGTMRMCRAALPVMRRQGSGCIVNISSIAGRIGIPFQALYSASKFAVEGFTEALRMEAAPFGIRVVLVEPGDFRTGFTGNRRLARAPVTGAYRERQSRAIAVMEHDERHGATPEAVARVVHHIVTRRSPRPRYAVGPLTERFALLLKRVVPARLFEWGLATYYRAG